MKILAIETSSHACSVAILNEDNIFIEHKIAPMQQTNLILPMIEALLVKASLSLTQLDAIAFGCGPGSFTGIRIASSVAQGLAFGAQLPVIPVSSLAAIAQAAYIEKQWPYLHVCVDARMGHVYWASYQVNDKGVVELVGEELACEPSSLQIDHNGAWYGVGDGWNIYQDKLISRLANTPKEINATQLPSAQALLTIAKNKFERGELMNATDALPVYLR